MGASLARTVTVAEPRAVITTSELLGRLQGAGALDGAEGDPVERVILVDESSVVAPTSVRCTRFDELSGVSDEHQRAS